MPVFFESGLLILIPVAFGIARKTGKSVFCYSIPLLAGLAIGHAFVPPTPGPVLLAEMLNVELSYVIILGIIIDENALYMQKTAPKRSCDFLVCIFGNMCLVWQMGHRYGL